MPKENVIQVYVPAQQLDEKIFRNQSAGEANADLDRIMFDWLCSDFAEDTATRNTKIVSYLLIKKTLASLESHEDPDDILSLELTMDV